MNLKNFQNLLLLATIVIFPNLRGCIEDPKNIKRDHRELNKDYGIKIGLNNSSCRSIALSPSEGLYLTSTQSTFVPEAEKFCQESHKTSGLQCSPTFSTLKTFSKSRSNGAYLRSENLVKSVQMKLEINGVPICQSNVMITHSGSKMTKRGNVPKIETSSKLLNQIENLKWPAKEEAKEFLQQEILDLSLLAPGTDPRLALKAIEESAEKCIRINEDSTATAFWDLDIRIGSHNYRGIVSSKEALTDSYGKVIEGQFFHADGAGDVLYLDNPNSETYEYKVKRVELTGLSNGPYLCNKAFVTDRAYSRERLFVFSSPTDPRTAEVTAFYNANQYFKWYRSLDLDQAWPGPQIRIDLKTEEGEGDPVYIPNGLNKTPTIEMGNGDDEDLQNLWIDPEVISHELGHHIIFQSLTSARGETKVLHEGLADYFVFAQTENPCLGETICPKNSRICVSNSCLRNAENNFKLSDFSEFADAHEKSQLISGLMWDVGVNIGHHKTASIVAQALNYLPRNGGFQDFISGLKSADGDLYSGQYMCTIYQAAISRGFEDYLRYYSCPN